MAIQISSLNKSSNNCKMSNRRPQRTRSDCWQSAHLVALPTELLSKILFYITCPATKPSNRVVMPESINATKPTEHLSLLPALSTCRRLYDVAIPLWYNSPKIGSTVSLQKLAQQIMKRPALGKFIRKLDLLTLTKSRNLDVKWMEENNPLSIVLSHTPLLREFSLDETLASHVDVDVVKILLCKSPYLEKFLFDSGSSIVIDAAFQNVQMEREAILTSITSVSLRECNSGTDQPFEMLLSSLPALRSLDVSCSSIKIDALMSIPRTARLENLDISFCDHLLGRGQVVEFLTSHPAVTESLTSLTAFQDEEDIGLSPEDISVILTHLPTTMTSLGLHSVAVSPEHISQLQKLRNLEYLAVGASINIADLEDMILSPGYEYPPSNREESPTPSTELTPKYQSVLGPLAAVISLCKLRRRLNSISPRKDVNTAEPSKLRHLDISAMTTAQQVKIIDSVLLAPCAMNLEVVELSSWALNWQDGLVKEVVRGVGWTPRNVGMKYWIERV